MQHGEFFFSHYALNGNPLQYPCLENLMDRGAWWAAAHGQNQFYSGEGIVKKGVDNTIRTVGRMAREGMRDTDREILDIMTESC